VKSFDSEPTFEGSDDSYGVLYRNKHVDCNADRSSVGGDHVASMMEVWSSRAFGVYE